MEYPKRENFLKHGIYHSEDLIKNYYRKTTGHFFDKGSMKFFNSRVSDSIYPGAHVIYFITSERFERDPRRYTLRLYRPVDGYIDTIGEFQGYATKASAAKAAIKLLIAEDKKF